ncbi:hypothetical protein [Pseudoneobacillus rhizosphaerae]|uniref:Uncharacterized protein n=1 Tax=Pseudoneobacillus rhizosphaerae TaxID=2880968 RepID=A0A9C7L9M8_9BACI|nr:hypothetical protein [Pseudoneobacillus rhizosphaerae]CAG9606570.1 hypothetical protein NEOCIP111885_00258 [Pseudoneobacillus rhizosphaerae]
MNGIGELNDRTKKSITQETIIKALDWSYDKAINGGIPYMDTAIELAESYIKKDGLLEDKVNSLIRCRIQKCNKWFFNGFRGIRYITRCHTCKYS